MAYASGKPAIRERLTGVLDCAAGTAHEIDVAFGIKEKHEAESSSEGEGGSDDDLFR